MRVKERLILLCLFLTAAPCLAAEIEWEVLPKGRPFRLTFADPREIRMGLNIAGGSRIQAAVGNYFSLLAMRVDEREFWHFGIEGAGYFGMRQAEGRFPLETTDGLIGLYLEGKRESLEWQLRYTHVSAHLADGSRDSAIAYSREFLKLRGAYAPSPFFQAYAGIMRLVNTVPDVGKWGLQWGANIFLPSQFELLVPFLAADFQIRQETSFNPSLSFQLGMAFNDPPEAWRSFRIFYSFQSGADPRGQFYDRALTLHALGIEMQI